MLTTTKNILCKNSQEKLISYHLLNWTWAIKTYSNYCLSIAYFIKIQIFFLELKSKFVHKFARILVIFKKKYHWLQIEVQYLKFNGKLIYIPMEWLKLTNVQEMSSKLATF